MKSRMKKTLIVFMFLCLAAVSVSRIAIRAYAAGSGNLIAKIYGTSEVVTYDGQEHKMPFDITYKVNDDNYPGRVDGFIELKKEYRKVDAGTYSLSLQSNYFDSFIATSSDYTFDDNSLIDIVESNSFLTINPVPLIITAKDWVCVYNGELQGPGDTDYNNPAEISGLAEAVGLQGNDSITFIELDGQGKEVGTYPLEITGYSINGVGKADIKNYSPITVVGGRLKIGYQVKITPGAHMTKTGTSGELTQISVNELIAPVSFTADDGYYFPEDYAVKETDGIKVTRVNDSEIEVSGKPAANVNITLPGAKAKENPPEPPEPPVPPVPPEPPVPPVPPVPHVHSPVLTEAVDSTCTEAGNTAYYVCETCGRWFEDYTCLAEITDKSEVVIKATGHRWDNGTVTKRATYMEEGLRTYTCLNDRSHTKTEVIPKVRRSSGGSEHTPPSVKGVWFSDSSGWHYRENGVVLKDAWRFLSYNGADYWYYFDEAGVMKTGWLDWDGKRYYLNPVSDGWMGRMLTGWQQIDGKWYYFETASGKNQGRMYRDERTPDGFYIGADGVWERE